MTARFICCSSARGGLLYRPQLRSRRTGSGSSRSTRGFGASPAAVPPPGASNLLEVRRIFVAQLTGGLQADALRDLIIASLNQASLNGSKLFILTENQERADAILKGAADDHTFEDTFDSQDSLSVRGNASTYGGSSNSSSLSRSSRSGGALGSGISENDSQHIKERKHEAYAAVRLCNRDGDVLWSTTQESLGAKFRGASADVAAKVARQLTLDVERARRPAILRPPFPQASARSEFGGMARKISTISAGRTGFVSTAFTSVASGSLLESCWIRSGKNDNPQSLGQPLSISGSVPARRSQSANANRPLRSRVPAQRQSSSQKQPSTLPSIPIRRALTTSNAKPTDRRSSSTNNTFIASTS